MTKFIIFGFILLMLVSCSKTTGWRVCSIYGSGPCTYYAYSDWDLEEHYIMYMFINKHEPMIVKRYNYSKVYIDEINRETK